MARKYFGTDGIRGLTNIAPMTAEMAMKVGMAAGAYFVRGDHRHRVVIGKDTSVGGNITLVLHNAVSRLSNNHTTRVQCTRDVLISAGG